MRGREPTRPGQRTAARLNLKPLPTPLPPPPRAGQTIATPAAAAAVRPAIRPAAAATGRPTVRPVSANHAVPPAPHFGTRFTPIDRATLTVNENESVDELPERLLTSPRVVLSLAASAAVLCLAGWLSMSGSELLTWHGVKRAVHNITSNESADEELPFITTVPMVPSSTMIARQSDSPATGDDPAQLADRPNDESASDDASAQRR